MTRIWVAGLILATAGCATLPSPPLHHVATAEVPRDARGDPVLAAVRPAPGVDIVAPAVIAAAPKTLSCKHFRRCPKKSA